MDRTASLIQQHGPFGVSRAASGAAQHAVSRRTGKTLCGRDPLTIFGVDLRVREQVTCKRCYRLGFASVNASARHIPSAAAQESAARS